MVGGRGGGDRGLVRGGGHHRCDCADGAGLVAVDGQPNALAAHGRGTVAASAADDGILGEDARPHHWCWGRCLLVVAVIHPRCHVGGHVLRVGVRGGQLHIYVHFWQSPEVVALVATVLLAWGQCVGARGVV